MKKLLVANWKMELAHDESCSWLEHKLPSVYETLKQTDHDLIICPSFTVLPYATALYPTYLWGAQDCGFKERGPYTGEVSARSLRELGIRFTLVGHSERRSYYGETDERVAEKVAQLLAQEIQPLICIGEETKGADRELIFRRQLEKILPQYHHGIPLYLAYEPRWAIGTGQEISPSDLQESVSLIKRICGSVDPFILYGGSIKERGAELLAPYVDGLLIGSASIDSELLKKIILSC